MPAAALDPSPTRMLICALLVLLFAGGVWSYIEWRSAAPPPPQVEMPGTQPR